MSGLNVAENWPFIFSGVVGVSTAALLTYLLVLRERYLRNVEAISGCFPHIINFSYNFIEDGVLKFRTLFETTIDEVARSPELERIMQLAAENCTEEDAFFAESDPPYDDSIWGRLQRKVWPELPWEKASEHLHLGILNVLSARHSDGHFGHAIIGLNDSRGHQKHANLGLATETFCFGLTCEKNRDVRARKIRVMIAAKDFLKYQVDEKAPRPQFERPNHYVRWETLFQMKRHMEREEEAAAQNKPQCRKVWDLSLSFIVPKLSPKDVSAEIHVAAQIEVLRRQITTLQDQVIRGAQMSRLARGADKSASCSWRCEAPDDVKFPLAECEDTDGPSDHLPGQIYQHDSDAEAQDNETEAAVSKTLSRCRKPEVPESQRTSRRSKTSVSFDVPPQHNEAASGWTSEIVQARRAALPEVLSGERTVNGVGDDRSRKGNAGVPFVRNGSRSASRNFLAGFV